jgi:hypothetical protein
MIIAGVLAGIIISSAIYATTGISIFGQYRGKPAQSSKINNAELAQLAYTVLGYIRDSDYKELARIAHPEYGVVFSPYSTISLPTNKCFQAVQIEAFKEDKSLYVWGVYSGSGEPIELTPAGYFEEFVFRKDYYSAPIVGINHIVRSGNALENITDVFHDVQFVDYYIPGTETGGAEDLSWSSLRLGFEEYDGKLMLTVILHSVWTV